MKYKEKSVSYTYEQIAEMSFKILTFANAAKSDAIQSIYAAKKGNFSEAEKRIASAHKMHDRRPQNKSFQPYML